MLQCKDITISYGEKNVLANVDITFESGKITAITGPNGCGKSTLLKATAGILSCSCGGVYLDGQLLADLTPAERAALIAFLPQNRNVPNIRVEKLVMHGRFPHMQFPRHYSSEDIRITQEALREMDIEALANCNVREISGGERQKTYLAMALAQQTDVILLDEPDTFLDIDHQIMLWEKLKELAAKGKTVAVVSHGLSLALGAADTVAVMRSGSVAGCGSPIEMKDVLSEVFNIAIKNVDGYYQISKKEVI